MCVQVDVLPYGPWASCVSGEGREWREEEELEGVKEAGEASSRSVAAVLQEIEGMEEAWAENPI